jgi:hypothetical protein
MAYDMGYKQIEAHRKIVDASIQSQIDDIEKYIDDNAVLIGESLCRKGYVDIPKYPPTGECIRLYLKDIMKEPAIKKRPWWQFWSKKEEN